MNILYGIFPHRDFVFYYIFVFVFYYIIITYVAHYILLPREKSYTDMYCLLISPPLTNCTMYFEMYVDGMWMDIEIKLFFFI